MPKIYILGENSFVGKTLFHLIRDKEECELVSKAQINFLKEESFSNVDFSNTIIIDCVNVNNGNEKDITQCNYEGFVGFCKYLLKSAVNLKYVYLSTISVVSEEASRTSSYVKSKKNAEDYLMSSGLDYQIMRLSYPIGKGENKNRLISKMIDSLKQDKNITIQDVQINFNDVVEVCENIYTQLLKNKVTFISNNNYTSLFDTVVYLKKVLHSNSFISKTDVAEQFMPKSETPFRQRKTMDELLMSCINEG